MFRTLMITKPMAPPWDDSAKNMARDIVFSVPERRFHLLSIPNHRIGADNAREEPFYFDVNSGYSPGMWMKMRLFFRMLRPEEIDLVHMFFQPNPLTLKMCWMAMEIKAHTQSMHTLTCAPGDFTKAAKHLFADRIVTVSRWTAEKLKAEGVKNISCIYPAVEAPGRSSNEERRKAREKYGLAEGVPVALFAGDLQSEKLAEKLVEILAGVEDENLILLVACRDKTEATPTYKKHLKDLAEKAGLGQRLRMLSKLEDMPSLFDAVDFQIFPVDDLYGKMDLPLVLMEAMGRGLPVLSADLPPLRELFPDDSVGRLIAPDDVSAWAAAISEWSKDSSLRDMTGLRSVELMRDSFSMEKLGREYEKLYRELEEEK